MKKWLNFLKVTVYIFFINLIVLITFVYVIEFYLQKNDPFFKLPFDTNYYNRYPNRYLNKITPPVDAKDYLYTWGHKVINNRFYRREKDFVTPKPEGVTRIIVLGDSFTWGAGLSTSQRYSNLLDSLLNDQLPEKKWEVINFSFAGGPTSGERDVLRSVKDVVEPDLIIIGFCLNDPQPVSQDYSPEREIFMQKNKPKLDSLRSNLEKLGLIYFGDLLEGVTYKIAEKLNYFPSWEEALDRTYQKNSIEWIEFRKALQDIKNISDSMHCPPPIFAAFNQLGSIEIPENISDHNKGDKYFPMRLKWFSQARRCADSLGFITVNYEPEFTTRLNKATLKFEELFLNELDAHPSPAMNKIYAELLFKVIKEKIILKEESH